MTLIQPGSASVMRSSPSRCFTAERRSRMAPSFSVSRAFMAVFMSSLICSRKGMCFLLRWPGSDPDRAKPGSDPKRLRRAGHWARLAASNSIPAGLVQLGRKHLRAHALVAALRGRSMLALALGGGLLVELAGAKLREEAGLFHRALEAAKRYVERLVFFDSDNGHWLGCFGIETGPDFGAGKPSIISGFTPSVLLILGIETSCDETGVALYDTRDGLLAEALHSQVELHAAYGGVVPELASRDHVRRLLPLTALTLERAGRRIEDVDLVAFTQGPGLGGALLVGAPAATRLRHAARRPAGGTRPLQGHLLSPLLAAPRPEFPFIALL